LQQQNQGRETHAYITGQLVYLHYPAGAHLQTGSRKIRCKYLGPLVIYKTVSQDHYVLMSLDGKVFPYLIEATRHKPGFIRTATKGTVNTLAELREALCLSP
jgi:hypothetical protein